MGEITPKRSLSEPGLSSDSITTNSGLVVNSEWAVEMTNSEPDNTNIDNYRMITGQSNISRPEKQILINHKRIK